MTRLALQHTYPQWEPPEDDPCAPEEEFRQVQHGAMRIVKNRRRARLLKRRGVPVWPISLYVGGPTYWLWFVDHPRLLADVRQRGAVNEPDYSPLED